MREKDATKSPERERPRETLLEIVNGFMLSQCAYVAAKLGIADMLSAGDKTADELAAAADADPASLYRILRTLASHGVFYEKEAGEFSLNPMADYLRSDSPESLRGWTIMHGEHFLWQPYGAILHSVRTGKPAFNHVFGMNGFEYLGDRPEAAAIFNDGMRSVSADKFGAVADAYEFSEIGTLVDVGGGPGGLLAAILRANPHVKGILGELPHVLEGAKKCFDEAGVADRCEYVSIDMFEGVPSGGDAYAMANVIHDWDDEHCITILENCRSSMNDGGRVLLIELVLSPRNEPHVSKFTDIEMLVMTEGGKERTESEYRRLLEAAGFRLSRVVPTESPYSVIEGVEA